MSYKKFWDELTDIYGNVCYYCRVEIATTLDHVVPYSWDQDNAIENLVPSCTLCNSLASNMLFDSVIQKQAYILKHREKYKNRRSICTDCKLPFAYRLHSPSMFLCAECYDLEYATSFCSRKEWKRWTMELSLAGIIVEAHKKACAKAGGYSHRNKGTFMSVLIEEYANIFDSDLSFFDTLCT